MPGWYIHMDAAREAIAGLASNDRAAAIFSADGGPSAADLQTIAQNNTAYVALGAIGPDIFFLLPDFKPPVGTGLWGAANIARILFQWWDDNFLGPFESVMSPIEANASNQADALTGGLASQLSDIFTRAVKFLHDIMLLMISRNYDVYGLLSSGQPSGFDEQVFFWSDMLHYRKTYEFAHRLWTDAVASGNDAHKAFALGWMTHLATDVTGHCFVNEKCGGPYRLHWQRHHLVENHMDAKVYDSEHGGQSIYQMISNSAQHMWIAFNPDGSSYLDYFAFPQPGRNYDPADNPQANLDRKNVWDVDSAMPPDLAEFIANALREVYTPATAASPLGAAAAAPKIIQDIAPDHADGFPNADDIVATYWWLFKYVKWTTTDYYKIRRPEPPELIFIQPFPSLPGTGDFDPAPVISSNLSVDASEVRDHALLALAWLTYLEQVLTYPVTVLAGIITSAATIPLRETIYELLELPLYNAWLAVHWYFAMTGYVLPMASEINPGLTTLGASVAVDALAGLAMSLADVYGGLPQAPLVANEASGHDRNDEYPRDVCLDTAGYVSALVNKAIQRPCAWDSQAPSEFTRPWRFPLANDAGVPIPVEMPPAAASPYKALQDATVLMGHAPGDNAVRAQFEACANEAQTSALAHSALANNTHLGDPVDYSAYVIAKLTRNDAGDAQHPIANFNLDADRGYGYLCWDWVRSQGVMGVPTPYFRGFPDQRAYHAPIAPGTGWCSDDVVPPPPAGGTPSSPANAPTMQGHPSRRSVRIRYIDREQKFQ
jgi:hypothetical protein